MTAYKDAFPESSFTPIGNGWAQASLYLSAGDAVENPFNSAGPFCGPGLVTVTRRPSGGLIVEVTP